jgi:hypothetical protein
MDLFCTADFAMVDRRGVILLQVNGPIQERPIPGLRIPHSAPSMRARVLRGIGLIATRSYAFKIGLSALAAASAELDFHSRNTLADDRRDPFQEIDRHYAL